MKRCLILFKSTKYRIELTIMFLLVLLNVLDFFELLDPFWDFIKKVVSWVLVGVMIYLLSPTKMMIGVRKKVVDLTYLAGAFAINIKDMIGYVIVSRGVMLAEAPKYFAIIKGAAVTKATETINLTAESFNSAKIIGYLAEGPSLIMKHAPEITTNHPFVSVAAQHGTEKISYSIIPQGLNGALLQLYNTITPYYQQIQDYGLITGVMIFLGVGLWLGLKEPVRGGFLSLFEKGRPKGLSGIIIKIIMVLLTTIFFYLFVFNLFMEWLAVAIDAPILMVALIMAAVALMNGGSLSISKLLKKSGDYSNELMIDLAKLFTDKKKVMLGLSGLLVLHLLTDIANFLLPFAMPMRDVLYLSRLGSGHQNIFSLVNTPAAYSVAVLNLIAWFFLLGMPGYIWYRLFDGRRKKGSGFEPDLPPWALALFYSSATALLISPMIWLRRISTEGLVGVDFYTMSSSGHITALLVAAGIFAITLVLSEFFRNYMQVGPILASLGIMVYYVFLFFTSSFNYYLTASLQAITSGSLISGLLMIIFMIMTVVFYTSSTIIFLAEIITD